MSNVILPKDIEELVEAEIAAGYAKDAQSLVASAVRGHLERLKILRQSLDEAEADYRENGGTPWDVVRADLTARLGLDADQD